jgi:hypothetical protein
MIIVLAFVLVVCSTSPPVIVNQTAQRVTLSNGFALASFNLEHPGT